MKIVAISILSPFDQFVLATMHDRWPLQSVLRPYATRRSLRRQAADAMKSPVRTLGQRLNREVRRWRDAKRRQAFVQILGEAYDRLPADLPTKDIRYGDVNSAETEQFLRELEPDLIITSGCPILKPNIFTIPRLATLNVHWGIAPAYRGNDTLFWPLAQGDYSNIGVTIHQIDEGIDTGPILAQAYPDLAPDDTEATVYAKCAELGSQALGSAIARIEQTQTVRGRCAKSSGQLFLSRDRRLRHELKYWWSRKSGRRVIPQTASRVCLYES